MIDIQACTITMELDFPVEIAREGDQASVSDVCFKMPNRKVAPHFENLCRKYKKAMSGHFAEMAKHEDPEEIAAIRAKIALEDAEKKKKGQKEGPLKSMENITMDEVMVEAEAVMSIMSVSDFDFESAYKLMDKMFLNNGDVRTAICFLGGKPITDGLLESINYRDLKKMMAVYISFFDLPVKSGTKSDSSTQPESHSPAREV